MPFGGNSSRQFVCSYPHKAYLSLAPLLSLPLLLPLLLVSFLSRIAMMVTTSPDKKKKKKGGGGAPPTSIQVLANFSAPVSKASWPQSLPFPDEIEFMSIICGHESISWAIHEGYNTSECTPTCCWRYACCISQRLARCLCSLTSLV